MCQALSPGSHASLSTPAPNFCHGKWCVPPGTSLEKSRRNISPSYSSGLETAGFSHVFHTVRITPHYTSLLVHHSLQLKSGWISDGLSWAQGEIEYGANKPCSDSYSPSWIPVRSCFFFPKHCVRWEKHLRKMWVQLWDNLLFLVNGKL